MTAQTFNDHCTIQFFTQEGRIIGVARFLEQQRILVIWIRQVVCLTLRGGSVRPLGNVDGPQPKGDLLFYSD